MPVVVPAAAGAEPSVQAARTLLLTGKYAEAKEAFGLVAKDDAQAAALGSAECDLATGQFDSARQTLETFARENLMDATSRARLAELWLAQGDYNSAQEWTDKSLGLDDKQPVARWVQAELHRLTGRLKEAEEAYDWFISYYNDTEEFTDPAALRYVALGAAQFARWRRLHDQFGFLVNELYPDILSLEKNFWRAHHEAGLLFLEKYNQADAEAEFQAALKINPNAAEVHAAMAKLALQNYELAKAGTALKRALEINPKLLVAHQLKADIEFANFEPAKAQKILEAALPLCPVAESTLGRLAAARGCVEGLTLGAAGTQLSELNQQVLKANPHAGEFFETLADSLDTLRRYPEAAHFYREAIRVMPQLVRPYGQLGLVYMRLGAEMEARAQLEKSFDVDFGNARIKNSLEVLDVLETYQTLETEHFLIRYDAKQDEIQARHIARYLEEIYPQLCEQLGYEPKEKSLFEIFNRAKNTDGHGWFSARMVGLPHIHTIGACAGKMVAMVSPGNMKQKFNWARVVKHEFVHVVNLQQTNFTIPHWFTEALAVYTEGYPRPPNWNEMLARRVPAGEVFDLDTINLGFIRPSSSEDWQMAYCQAELYAEYMLSGFGKDALAKMLAAYADNLDTRAAIDRAFGVTQGEFEKGYSEFVKKTAEQYSKSAPPKQRSFNELTQAVKDDPKDADALAGLAAAYLQRKAFPKAGSLANSALKIDPKHQVATYVKARLQILIGNSAGLMELIDDALDRQQPQKKLLLLAAGLRYKAGEYEQAAALYRLGREKFPGDDTWTKLLARVYLKSGNSQSLAPLLEEMANADGDDLTIRKKLAEMAVETKDYEAAVRWASQAIHINVLDVDVHRLLAEALGELREFDRAIEAYETAVEIEPQQLRLRFALADACVQAGQKGKARQVLKELLALDPAYPGADVLLESLEK